MFDLFIKEENHFSIFGLEHLLSILSLAVLFYLIIKVANNWLNLKQQKVFGLLLALSTTIAMLGRTYIYYLIGEFSWQESLPLYICRLATLFVPFLMWYKNEFLFGVLYFWILGGTLQAIITPDIVFSFPHYESIFYWHIHGVLILVILYAVFVYKMKPKWQDLLNAFLLGFIYLILIHGINYLLDANYSYTMSKPPGGSLLDFLGPWPWYLLSGNLLALSIFLLLYLPFYRLEKLSLRRHKKQ